MGQARQGTSTCYTAEFHVSSRN